MRKYSIYVGINTEHTLYCVATSSSGVGVRRWTTAHTLGSTRSMPGMPVIIHHS